jgi:5'(3')-deoxyribonucleotidase
MRILVDLDGVCAEIHEQWVEKLNYMYDLSATVADIRSWGFIDSAPFDKLTMQQVLRPLYDTLFFYNAKVVPGSQEVLKGWVDEGHDVIFVSTPAHTAHSWAEKMAWVEEHFPFIGYKNLVLTARKDCLVGDIMIDDAPHNLENFQKTNPEGLLVTIDSPWHEKTPVPEDTVVAADWTDRAKAWDQIRTIVEAYDQTLRIIEAEYRRDS